MKYVLGIDSGGTRFRVTAATLSGEMLAAYEGPSANQYHMPKDKLILRMIENIGCCLKQFGGKPENAVYIFCGASGVDSERDQQALYDIYRNLPGFCCGVTVINDAELAHRIVTNGEGVLIISGTGSIVFAKAKDGRTVRAGGYLFSIMGDEGSGIWVSRMILREVGRHFDGASPRGILVDSVMRELSISSRDDLNRMAAHMAEMPWDVPQLGKLADDAADKGDKAAKRILLLAAKELVSILRDAVLSLRLDETEPDFQIGLWGSTLLKSQWIGAEFERLCKQAYPMCRIVRPTISAVEGAVQLAVEEAAKLG